jgi:hypothetical protein
MSSTVETPTEIRTFNVDIPEEQLAELRRRIDAARWPSKEVVADRSQGVQLATLQELARYWTTDYDWRKLEAKLNALPQFTTEIDGVDIHFIHVRSKHEDAMPLIITHGWPGSVLELLEVVGPLTDPTAHGGRAEDAFDLVLPSMPGYGFRPSRRSPGGRGSHRASVGGADEPPWLHPHIAQEVTKAPPSPTPWRVRRRTGWLAFTSTSSAPSRPRCWRRSSALRSEVDYSSGSG